MRAIDAAVRLVLSSNGALTEPNGALGRRPTPQALSRGANLGGLSPPPRLGRYWNNRANTSKRQNPASTIYAAVKDGTAGSMLSRILEAIKPEPVYFTEQNGQRGAVLIGHLPDPSKIPALAEPWFLTFQADVEFRVVTSPDDLQRAGLDEQGKKWS